MIVEDERDVEGLENLFESECTIDDSNINSGRSSHAAENELYFQAFHKRDSAMRDANKHQMLRDDLVSHLWMRQSHHQ